MIFDQKNADFSKMLQSPEPLVVSKVIQKAFIEVNEEGAEAAATTSKYFLAVYKLDQFFLGGNAYTKCCLEIKSGKDLM